MTTPYTASDGRVKSAPGRSFSCGRSALDVLTFPAGYTNSGGARRTRRLVSPIEEVRTRGEAAAGSAAATEAPDEQLVAAAREGSDEAFEALFRRYRDRVVGYVRGMVSDHGRAEDIVQEAFMSALRGAARAPTRRSCSGPGSTRSPRTPASTTCAARAARRRSRSTRTTSARRRRAASPSRDRHRRRRSRAAKELESLRMAFGDLPQSQHQILVMRELEGLSYDRSASAWASRAERSRAMLFRARRRLRDGFDEIDTGERCVRMRVTMEAAADGSAPAARAAAPLQPPARLQPCRRTAVAMGLDALVLGSPGPRRSALRRVAGLLPLPPSCAAGSRTESPALDSVGPAGVEQGASLAGKATAVVVAAVVAAGGAGVAHKASGGELSLGRRASRGAGPATAAERLRARRRGTVAARAGRRRRLERGGGGAAGARRAAPPAGGGPGGQAGRGRPAEALLTARAPGGPRAAPARRGGEPGRRRSAAPWAARSGPRARSAARSARWSSGTARS